MSIQVFDVNQERQRFAQPSMFTGNELPTNLNLTNYQGAMLATVILWEQNRSPVNLSGHSAN